MTSFLLHIQNHLECHKSRAKTILEMVMGIIQSRSVQSQRIASHMGKHGLKSRLERIRRLYSDQEIDQMKLAELILTLLGMEDSNLSIILDRTNWMFGKTDINYLVIAVQIEGFGAIPLCFELLDKKGNSNTNERINLFSKFLESFPNIKIKHITADREFVGNKWISYLHKNNIKFCIRIKENYTLKFENSDETTSVKNYFIDLRIGQHRAIYKKIDGYEVIIAATRSKKGELVIVVTNMNQSAKKIMKIYKMRWGIECLFKSLKSQGFNVEDTHMVFPERLKKLMSLCALAATFCLKIGLNRNKIKPIPYKKTVNSLLYSYFSYGLNHIRSYFQQFMDVLFKGIGNHLFSNDFLNGLKK